MSEDSWSHLKAFTAARIALGRSGASIPTRERLDFQLSHARARDAVLTPFQPEELADELAELLPSPLVIESRAHDRSTCEGPISEGDSRIVPVIFSNQSAPRGRGIW